MKSLVSALAITLALASASNADVLTGSYVQGNIGVDSYAGSVEVGHNFGLFSVEGEYLHLGTSGPLLSIPVPNKGSSYFLSKVDGNFVNANAVVTPVTVFGVSPFVKAGVGYGMNVGSVGNGLVYNVGAGISYAFDDNWSVDAEYRHLFSDGVVGHGTNGTYETQLVTTGVKYTF